MKHTFWRFLVANLSAGGIGILLDLLGFGMLSSLFSWSADTSYALRAVIIALALPFTMYVFLFRHNKRFGQFCLERSEASVNELFSDHLKKNVFNLIWLAGLLLYIAYANSRGPMTLENANDIMFDLDVINIHFHSVHIFLEEIPSLFGIEPQGFVQYLLWSALWGFYVVAAYLLTLRRAIAVWKRKGAPERPFRYLLIYLNALGLLFHVQYWLWLPILACRGNSENGWTTMLSSLLIVVIFEVLYLTEAIWETVRKKRGFCVFRLCAVCISAFFAFGLYNGVLSTVIANIAFVAVFITEIISLVRHCMALKRPLNQKGSGESNLEVET